MPSSGVVKAASSPTVPLAGSAFVIVGLMGGSVTGSGPEKREMISLCDVAHTFAVTATLVPTRKATVRVSAEYPRVSSRVQVGTNGGNTTSIHWENSDVLVPGPVAVEVMNSPSITTTDRSLAEKCTDLDCSDIIVRII